LIITTLKNTGDISSHIPHKGEIEKATQKFEAATQAEEAGEFSKARRLYEKASLLAPTHPLPRVRLAILLSEQGKWKEAIPVARKLIKRWPRIQLPYVLIATSYTQLGRLKLAERFYRQGLAINKNDPNLLLFLGSLLADMEQNDEAQKHLRKALNLDPNNEEIHYNLGRVYRAKGKFNAAEKHLKRAIEMDPKYALAHAALGQLLVRTRLKEARSFLRRAVKYNPNDGWSIAYLAATLNKLRKLKAADEQYRRLLELWPNHPMSNWLYGDFLASYGKNSSTAERYLRKAVEIAPRNEWANYFLGKYLLYSDRNEEAKIFLTKAARQGHSKARELLRQMRMEEHG
jgi:tetratricopeptide (TPR) repeat protein